MKRSSGVERVEEIKMVATAARPARPARAPLRHSASASAAPLRDRQAFPIGPVLCSRCQSLRFYTDPALAPALAPAPNRTSLKDTQVTFVTANHEPAEIALRSLC